MKSLEDIVRINAEAVRVYEENHRYLNGKSPKEIYVDTFVELTGANRAAAEFGWGILSKNQQATPIDSAIAVAEAYNAD